MTDDTKIALITGASRGIGGVRRPSFGSQGMFIVGNSHYRSRGRSYYSLFAQGRNQRERLGR